MPIVALAVALFGSQASRNPTPSEQRVRDAVRSGHIVSIANGEIVRGEFLASLIIETEEGLLPQSPVRITCTGIAGANPGEVSGPVDLFGKRIDREIQIMGCTFRSAWDAGNAEFSRGLRLENCKFDDTFNLKSAHVAKDLSLSGSTFKEKVVLDGLRADSDVVLDRSIFSGKIDIQGNFLNVAGSLYFSNVAVSPVLQMRYLTVGELFVATHLSSKRAVDLYSLSAGEIKFDRATCEAGVDLRRSTVKRNADYSGSRFLDESEDSARFDYSETGGTLTFGCSKDDGHQMCCAFRGRTDLRSVRVGSDFDIRNSDFASVDRPANFNSINIGHVAYFDGAHFCGSMDIGDATIGSAGGGSFESDDVRYDASASFQGMTVSGPIHMNATSFGTVAIFNGAVVRDEMWILPNRPPNGLDMRGLRCEALFIGRSQEGTYNQKTCDDLTISNNSVGDSVDLDLSWCRIRRELCIVGADFQTLNVSYGQVEGATSLRGIKVAGSADARNVVLGRLRLPRAIESININSCDLSGWNFAYIGAPDNVAGWNRLRSVLSRCHCGIDTYQRVETFYNAAGYFADANQAFYSRRIRETSDAKGFAKVWGWFLRLVVGYGRFPERALYWWATLATIGYIVFSEDRMEAQPTENLTDHARSKRYSRLFYTCDVLIPFVDLGLSKVWSPKSEYPIRAAWASLSKLLGWFLVPIGLASITGILK